MPTEKQIAWAQRCREINDARFILIKWMRADGLTWEYIGDRLHLSRDRVRQIWIQHPANNQECDKGIINGD